MKERERMCEKGRSTDRGVYVCEGVKPCVHGGVKQSMFRSAD